MADRCEAGDRCRAYDPQKKQAFPEAPLCSYCLDSAERDVRALVLDYRDLEQHLPPSLGQWGDGQPRGRSTALPLSVHVLDLQVEIHWLTDAWDDVIRERERLSEKPSRVRSGWAVQQAVSILAPRLHVLAGIGPQPMWDYPGTSEVCPAFTSHPVLNSSTVLTVSCSQGDGRPCGVCGGTGRVATSTEQPGWQGVLDLSRLHQRARSALGLTAPKKEHCAGIPCRNPECDLKLLFRIPGTDEVRCDACSMWYDADAYRSWVALVSAAARRDRAA